MAASSSCSFSYFEVQFWGFCGNWSSSRKVFLAAHHDETIGGAIARILSDHNVCVREITAARTLDGERTHVESDTPVAALQQFMYKFIMVELAKQEEQGDSCTQDKPQKDVFHVLMSAQKSYTHLPEESGDAEVSSSLFFSVAIQTSWCFFCGDTDILRNEDEPIVTMRTQYSIVRPLCRGCFESGKVPAVRNALKVNKKK